jgi:sigma-B regulation protein RsbU (phosphoserine phosphatase)
MLLPEISTTFLTSCFAHLDPVGRVMQYASAGHPPMLLMRAGSEEPEWLQAQGVPIGAIPDPGYRTQDVPLLPGDRLIMYSDGLTEAGDPDTGLFDYQGVERYVRDARGMSLERFADGLLSEAARFDRHPGDLSRFRDDLTLIVVQVS